MENCGYDLNNNGKLDIQLGNEEIIWKIKC